MEVPRHWRMKKQRYVLVGETCPHCKAHLFPPRAVCPYCAANARQGYAYREQEPVMAVIEQGQPVNR